MFSNATGMIRQATVLLGEKVKLAGDVSSLLEQIGSPEESLSTGSFYTVDDINDADGLSQFLKKYHSEILVAVELPAITQAYLHSTRNECRELVALDQALASEPRLQKFAAASQRIGRIHLDRLRPMRDSRLVQRYLLAIEGKSAHAWHTLVYGLTLALYSVPLRQGLIAYGDQTLGGFARCAARRLNISTERCLEISSIIANALPANVDALVARSIVSCK